MVATVEEHTGSWGHRGPVNGLSIKSVQIPRHPGCRCVCILVDRETMCLSNSCSVSQMLNDPLSHVQFWFVFFFKEKFPNLTTGKVAQVAGRVSMAYQKARDTQRQGPQSQTKREKSRCLHWGSPEGTLLESHISPQRDESVPGARSVFSAHTDNGSITLELPLPQ